MQEALFASTIFCSSLAVSMVPKLITSFGTIKKLFPFLTLTTAGFLLGVQLLELNPHMTSGCKGHGTGHDHGEYNAHSHGDFQMLGFFVAGLSFIFLLAVDTVILKHKHCDEGERERHAHEHSHGHVNEKLEEQGSKDISGTVASIPVNAREVANPGHSERLGCCDTSLIKNTSSRTQVFIYVLGISIHSFFEGLVFKSDGNIGSLEVGLVLHKVLESFALGVPLFTSGFKFSNGFLLAVFYSSLTPIGILINAEYGEVNQGIKSMFTGLALGSIMFMVFVEMIPPMFNHQKGTPIYRILTLFIGYLLSATVIYYSHAH